MTTETQTNQAATAATTAVVKTPRVKKEKAPKPERAPSKISQANAIFAAKLAERTEGKFASNKEFRQAVLRAMEKDLGVTTASAATMYNAAKTAAEAADPKVALGRDPKVVKAAKEPGKRGRKAGAATAPATTGDTGLNTTALETGAAATTETAGTTETAAA